MAGTKLDWYKLLRYAHELDGPEHRLLVTLAGYTDENLTRAFPGNEQIAHYLQVSEDYVRKLLRRLEAKGWIVCTHRGGGRHDASEYALTWKGAEIQAAMRERDEDWKPQTERREEASETPDGASEEASETPDAPSRNPRRSVSKPPTERLETPDAPYGPSGPTSGPTPGPSSGPGEEPLRRDHIAEAWAEFCSVYPDPPYTTKAKSETEQAFRDAIESGKATAAQILNATRNYRSTKEWQGSTQFQHPAGFIASGWRSHYEEERVPWA